MTPELSTDDEACMEIANGIGCPLSTCSKKKYCNGMDILPRSLHSTSYNVWKGIMTNKDTLHRSIDQAVADGNSTYFWMHGWLGCC